jgi:hypothetical protein
MLDIVNESQESLLTLFSLIKNIVWQTGKINLNKFFSSNLVALDNFLFKCDKSLLIYHLSFG